MANRYALERLAGLIEHYMETRSRPVAISTAKTARALTTLMSVCPLSGRELEDAIAEAAVRHGHSVHFDFDDPIYNKPNFDVPERIMVQA